MDPAVTEKHLETLWRAVIRSRRQALWERISSRAGSPDPKPRRAGKRTSRIIFTPRTASTRTEVLAAASRKDAVAGPYARTNGTLLHDLCGGVEECALPRLSQTERFVRSPESTGCP